jgi:putative transposase
MNRHVLKLRKTPRFALWQGLYSQVCQEVCKRMDAAYQRFFHKLAKGPPKFRKAKHYRSFTFPQSGYKVEGNKVQVCEALGDERADQDPEHQAGCSGSIVGGVEEMAVGETRTGQSGGFDFGLKTFLTDDQGRQYTSPLFLNEKLNRQLLRKQEGSRCYKWAGRALAQAHGNVTNKRQDHHFKLAHRLCDEYDTLYFKDLNLTGMKALRGRKVSDLGFSSFLAILKWVAFKRGKCVIQIDCFTPTTKSCSSCGQKHELTLRDRVLSCECGLTMDRDQNAAINIKTAGTSAVYLSEHQPQGTLRTRVDGSSPRL